MKKILLFASLALNILCIGTIAFYEHRTHNVEILLESLGIHNVAEIKRPEYYWINDWNTCIKKLGIKADIALLGDSITAGSEFQSAFPGLRIVEFGHCGDRVDGMTRRSKMLSSVNPNKIFIMGGINDLHRSSPNVVSQRYNKLIEDVKEQNPNATIYVQSILPIVKTKEKLYSTNETIIETNSMIKRVAELHKCNFIDLYDHFLNEGYLDPTLTKDGIHLNEKGNEVWCKLLSTYINE